jgi:glycosyltransferase involved in cell wall biosynthesis
VVENRRRYESSIFICHIMNSGFTKIVIATPLYPPDIGGPATYSKLLADELPKHDFEVTVVSYGSVRKFPKGLSHLVYTWKLFINSIGCNVVFALDPVSVGVPACFVSWILHKRLFIKIVGDYAWEQGVQRFGVKEVLDDFLNQKYGCRVELLRKIERFVALHAEKIIVPSKYLRGVVEKWGISEEKIIVIYNAFEMPDVSVSKESARLKLGLTGSVLVSAGRNVPWKGFEVLRDIMPEATRHVPDCKLYILTNETRENLLLYLLASDVFVLNTAYEGLSHQLLEAMALGKAIVTTNVGGNPELIEDGKEGFLVRYNDKEALVEKICAILSNSELAQRLGQNAYKKAQEFSKERMITETVNILKQ